MSQFLKLCSSSHRVFLPITKIFPIIRRDSKLFILKFSSSIKYHYFERGRKADEKQDKIILYQNKDSQYFKKIKLLTLSNFIIWTLFGVNTYDSLSNEPNFLNDELREKWNKNERTRHITKSFIIVSMILGFFLVLAVWVYFLRSVKQIQLIKSIKVVEFQTYSFFPSVREFSIPLNDVSGVCSRHSAKGYVPVKIRNTWFYFLIDVKGHFPDAFLFDNSIGVQRDFKSMKGA